MNIKIEDYLSKDDVKSIISKAIEKRVFDIPEDTLLQTIKFNVRQRQKLFSESPNTDIKCEDFNDNHQKYYVYAFINDDWDHLIFYIGKGCNNRYKDLKDRSMHVTSILGRYKCHSEILEYCDTEREAYKKETEYKKKFKLLGYPIIDSERESIKIAQREGIEKAKKEGKYRGGQNKRIDFDTFKILYNQYSVGEITKVEFAKMIEVSRPTLYRIIKDYNNGLMDRFSKQEIVNEGSN